MCDCPLDSKSERRRSRGRCARSGHYSQCSRRWHGKHWAKCTTRVNRQTRDPSLYLASSFRSSLLLGGNGLALAPLIDFYSPDIYWPEFEYWVKRYEIGGNPIFVPEAKIESAPYNALSAHGDAQAFGLSIRLCTRRPIQLIPNNTSCKCTLLSPAWKICSYQRNAPDAPEALCCMRAAHARRGQSRPADMCSGYRCPGPGRQTPCWQAMEACC